MGGLDGSCWCSIYLSIYDQRCICDVVGAVCVWECDGGSGIISSSTEQLVVL